MSDIILWIRHEEDLRCLQIMEVMTATIESVFRLGFLVFKHDIKRERKVGALLLSSLFIESVACLKFLTKSIDFNHVSESKNHQSKWMLLHYELSGP